MPGTVQEEKRILSVPLRLSVPENHVPVPMASTNTAELGVQKLRVKSWSGT